MWQIITGTLIINMPLVLVVLFFLGGKPPASMWYASLGVGLINAVGVLLIIKGASL